MVSGLWQLNLSSLTATQKNGLCHVSKQGLCKRPYLLLWRSRQARLDLSEAGIRALKKTQADIRILCSIANSEDKGDSGNHGLQDPHVGPLPLDPYTQTLKLTFINSSSSVAQPERPLEGTPNATVPRTHIYVYTYRHIAYIYIYRQRERDTVPQTYLKRIVVSTQDSIWSP